MITKVNAILDKLSDHLWNKFRLAPDLIIEEIIEEIKHFKKRFYEKQ